MVTEVGMFNGDLNALSNSNALDGNSVAASISKDESTLAADANIVRSDLGLAPSSS
jgi:hypothetical protein